MKSRRSCFLFIVVAFTIILAIWGGYVYRPYLNYILGGYNYKFPEKHEEFIVYSEPDQPIPNFIRKIIVSAFSDRKVVFSNEKHPHLIVRDRNIVWNKDFAKYGKIEAPYLIYLWESHPARTQKYFRKNGLPLIELTSSTPSNKRQMYFPFIIWNGSMVRERTSPKPRTKFMAYVSSNCKKVREQLFNLLKARTYKEVDAYGQCSNPTSSGTRYNSNLPGTWNDLEGIYSNYNFAFAMENKKFPGYISEKIITVLKAGAIPIYWGDSKTIEKYFNQDAYIDVGKFASLEDAADFIVELSNKPERVRKMQEAPMFKDNIMPELFKIDIDERLDYPIIQETAAVLRKRYFKLLEKDKKGVAGWNLDVWKD